MIGTIFLLIISSDCNYDFFNFDTKFSYASVSVNTVCEIFSKAMPEHSLPVCFADAVGFAESAEGMSAGMRCVVSPLLLLYECSDKSSYTTDYFIRIFLEKKLFHGIPSWKDADKKYQSPNIAFSSSSFPFHKGSSSFPWILLFCIASRSWSADGEA